MFPSRHRLWLRDRADGASCKRQRRGQQPHPVGHRGCAVARPGAEQVLRADDVRELYETALLLLEQQQGELPGETAAFEAARAAIEQGLLRMPAGGGGAR